jgi:hypothetical protein
VFAILMVMALCAVHAVGQIQHDKEAVYRDHRARSVNITALDAEMQTKRARLEAMTWLGNRDPQHYAADLLQKLGTKFPSSEVEMDLLEFPAEASPLGQQTRMETQAMNIRLVGRYGSMEALLMSLERRMPNLNVETLHLQYENANISQGKPQSCISAAINYVILMSDNQQRGATVK